MQQLRYNEGKAKLSYFYANERATRRWREARQSCSVGWYVGVSQHTASAVRELTEFLASGPGSSFDALAGAVGKLLCGLEFDINGSVEGVVFDGRTIEETLASAPDALAAFCAVCEYGEAKYLRGNFRKGAPITQYLDSALRHINARLRGEILDPESGKPHLAHALWNVWTALDQPDSRDDRLPAVYDPADDFGPESELPEPREETLPPRLPSAASMFPAGLVRTDSEVPF